MMHTKQHTLKEAIHFEGIGLHTGKKVKGNTDINKYFNEFDENGNLFKEDTLNFTGQQMDKFILF